MAYDGGVIRLFGKHDGRRLVGLTMRGVQCFWFSLSASSVSFRVFAHTLSLILILLNSALSLELMPAAL